MVTFRADDETNAWVFFPFFSMEQSWNIANPSFLPLVLVSRFRLAAPGFFGPSGIWPANHQTICHCIPMDKFKRKCEVVPVANKLVINHSSSSIK
jgi:hypothetical protein